MKPATLFYIRRINWLREMAKEHGYALAVHGSMARDLDLVAIPWIEGATEPHTFAVAFQEKLRLCTGEKWYPTADSPTRKCHNRLVWNFVPQSGGDWYIDLGVMEPNAALTPANAGKE